MSDGLNRVMLLGALGADPELRFTRAGQAVLNMRLATNESYTDKEGKRQERVEWHTVVMWGKRGESLSKHLVKGSRIFVEGRLCTTEFDDRDGNRRRKTEVIAIDIMFAGGARADGDRRDAPPIGNRRDDRPAPQRGYPDPRHHETSAAPQAPREPEYGSDVNGGSDDDIPF
jgi:single-strand DNA-binding protein